MTNTLSAIFERMAKVLRVSNRGRNLGSMGIWLTSSPSLLRWAAARLLPCSRLYACPRATTVPCLGHGPGAVGPPGDGRSRRSPDLVRVSSAVAPTMRVRTTLTTR